jgi:hypothetical protein
MTAPTLADLRTTGMTGRNLATCPLCGCWKGGDVDEPNCGNDACGNSACRCHDRAAVDLPFRCSCGAAQFATEAARRAAQPDGVHKCPTCRTFATDHEWRGDWSSPDDNVNPRCWDCDIRFGSHR